MLVLTRKRGKEVMIGNNIRIAVLSIKSNQVRLGIDAPKNITVHRTEIYDRIQEAANQCG